MSTINETPVTVSGDRASVERSIERKPDGVTAEYTVRPTAATTVEVVVVEEILSGIPSDDIGFHPDHEPDTWSVEDNDVRFEATVAPGESYTTVLGVRTGGEATTPFVGRPRIESASTVDAHPDDVDSSVDGAATESVDDVDEVFGAVPAEDDLAADLDGAEEADLEVEATDLGEGDAFDPDDPFSEPVDDADEETETDPSPDATADATGRTFEVGGPDATGEEWGDGVIAPPPIDEEDDAEADAADGDSTTGADPVADARTEGGTEGTVAGTDSAAAPPAAGDGSLAARLAAEIEAGEVPDEDLNALRDALGGADGGSPDSGVEPTDALRIDHLQSRVEDVAAYGAAVETFLDAYGSPEAFAREVTEETDAVRDALETGLESAAEERAALRETVEDDLAAVRDERETLAAEVEDATDRLDALEADLEDLQGLEESLSDVEEALADVEESLSDVEEALADVEESLADVESTVDDAEADVAALDDRVEEELAEATEAVADLRADHTERLETVEDEIEEFRRLRESLQSAFGPGGGLGGAGAGGSVSDDAVDPAETDDEPADTDVDAADADDAAADGDEAA